MSVHMDDYFKRLMRNYLLGIKQAVAEHDDARAYELCDDLVAIFCASVTETHDELEPRRRARAEGPTSEQPRPA